ncbi:M23 family metallopeptidase [Cronbergia sp. UHCC 0137]|uniref:M23 family metallopeptidase n=1 Tax=Cronbergia sp. UHCC 0137 TaxID=3110239 RepID=UPI002B1FE9BD|nr:M23 family metallopeptidase [Cronbergia sp. UHCC 0137]MEA5618743.1 M23 family metallopeptidase [Cronbergia sp. UHCC 0137]
MTQRNKSAHKNLYSLQQQGGKTKRFASTLPAQSLCWLSSLSLLSSGFVVAQTETSIDNIVPTIENSEPAVAKQENIAPKLSPSKPDFSERRIKLKKKLQGENVTQAIQSIRQSKPKVEKSQPAVIIRTSKPQSSPKNVSEVAQPINNSTTTIRATESKTKDFNNAYIDTNSYDNTATGKYQPPSSVVITERSSACRTVLSAGKASSAACNKAPENNSVANSQGKSAPTWLKKSENASLAKVEPSTTKVENQSVPSTRVERVAQTVGRAINGSSHTKTAYRPNRFIPQPSEFATTTVNSSPIAAKIGTLAPPMIEGNVAPRTSTVSYDFALASVLPKVSYNQTVAYYGGGSGMRFPLAVPAPITSLFGWRIHPITGDRRFHAGTDLGAPMGTPVLATAKGQIETADWVGGYGLTVMINHASAQQTLYGHLSEIFVRPGQWVEPGTVIGRVGSTGNSTGPHLHYEIRHLTQNGWVAVNPGVQLETSLSQLIRSTRTARLPE